MRGAGGRVGTSQVKSRRGIFPRIFSLRVTLSNYRVEESTPPQGICGAILFAYFYQIPLESWKVLFSAVSMDFLVC